MHARSPIVLMTAGVLAASGLAGCGRVDQSEKPDGARPPVTLQVSAAITDRGVNVSPDRIGGGPVRLIVTNQSSKTVKATLSGSGSAGSRATKDPIPPGGVAAIQGTVTPGTWKLEVGSGIDAGTIRVTKTRESSDGELLLP